MTLFEEKLKNLSFLVGNTPMLAIEGEIEGEKHQIFAKYEAWNYTGSVKDRMALKILEAAYRLGTLEPTDTIIEATSGNTGIALAAMGAYLGLKVEILMPAWLSDERKRLLRFYGAKLTEISEKQGGFEACITLAAEKSAKKGFFGPKQFKNVWNVMAHKDSTAPEFHNSLRSIGHDKLDIFITGVGTGGTVMGFYHYFSELYPDFKTFPLLPGKNTDAGHRIEGIGDSFIPDILDLGSMGPIFRVSDTDAINVARQLNKMGLSVGISSGANIFGALCKATQHPGKIVGTILCDDNKKYLSTDLCSDTSEPSSRNIKILDYKRLT